MNALALNTKRDARQGRSEYDFGAYSLFCVFAF